MSPIEAAATAIDIHNTASGWNKALLDNSARPSGALGVPPMLLGIPGDNTFSNYQEAQRAFWRDTVLPLVNRMCQGFSKWLGAGFGGDTLFALGDLVPRAGRQARERSSFGPISIKLKH